MSKHLSKSLAELDAAADELLKSKAADTDEEIAPEDVSSNATPTPEEDGDKEKDEEVEKSCADSKDLEKGDGCSDCKKSDSEEDSDEEEPEPIAKSEDTEDADDEVEDEEEEDEEEDVDSEEIEKSLADDFQANGIIADATANSEFAAAIAEVIVKSLADVQYDVQSQDRAHSQSTEILAKSMQAILAENKSVRAENEKLTRRINKLEKSVTSGFDRVMDALDDISTQPAGMRKSLGNINVQERDFAKSIGATQPTGFEALSKSQVLDILAAELISGNPQVTQQDIIGYESGAPLASNLQSLVASKISR